MTALRRGAPFPRNSNNVYIPAFIDLTDPAEANGNPKYVNNATGYWELRDADTPTAYSAVPNVDGHTLASGSPVALGSGLGYRCDLIHTLPIVANTQYWFHVVLISTSGYVVDMTDTWEAIQRTGRTPVS